MIKILAPAKINLFLDVGARRPDGYHEIRTVFQTVALYDEIRVVPLPGAGRIRLKASGGAPRGSSNIVWKAAESFLGKYRPDRSCALVLKKNIPIQAGLGGGSSDAAAVLRALSRFWRPPAGGLRRIARELGADVPFFLEGGCALAAGTGEKIVPIRPAPDFWAVIVKPRMGLSTREAYGWLDRSRGKRAPGGLTRRPGINRILSSIKREDPPEKWAPHLYNGFEEVVFPKAPELARLKRALLENGSLGALLSGSGSALFGVAPDRARAEKIRRGMLGRGARVWLARSVGKL